MTDCYMVLAVLIAVVYILFRWLYFARWDDVGHGWPLDDVAVSYPLIVMRIAAKIEFF